MVVDVALVLGPTSRNVVRMLGWGNSAGMLVGGALLVAATVRVAGALTMEGVARTAVVAAVGAVVGGVAGYKIGESFADVSFSWPCSARSRRPSSRSPSSPSRWHWAIGRRRGHCCDADPCVVPVRRFAAVGWNPVEVAEISR